jgi:hypothetical protein
MNKVDIEKLHNKRQNNNVSKYIKASDAAPEEMNEANHHKEVWSLIEREIKENIEQDLQYYMKAENRKLCAVYRY